MLSDVIPFLLSFLQISVLGNFTNDLILVIILVIIGIVIIALVAFFIVLLPAILLAVVVYFLTGSIFWAGVVFLIIAALSLLRKI